MTGKITNPAQDHPQSVSQKRLWFGFGGAGIAWVLLGCADLLTAYYFCAHSASGGSTLLFVLTFLLLITAIGAGWTGFQTFRNAAREPLTDSHAIGRQEFMGMVGMLMAISLGLGIIWLGIPAMILDFCVRAK